MSEKWKPNTEDLGFIKAAIDEHGADGVYSNRELLGYIEHIEVDRDRLLEALRQIAAEDSNLSYYGTRSVARRALAARDNADA